MPVPWMTLAQAVPWSDVIKHAPSVVDAARKLLKRKSGEDPAGGALDEDDAAAPTSVADAAAPPTPAQLSAQLQRVRAEAAELRTQLADTQQLLQDLTEQHAQVLAQVEDNRVRLEGLRRLLLGVTAVAVVSAVLLVGLLVKLLG